MKNRPQITDIGLSDLDTLSTPELQPIYIEVMGYKPPHKASARFLRSNIAWALQAKRAGHDPHALRRSLIKQLSQSTQKKRPRLQPGTRLVREWHGETHEVVIREKDYLWRGESYSSLSTIATEITGTRWSGPRFFGLKSSKS